MPELADTTCDCLPDAVKPYGARVSVIASGLAIPAGNIWTQATFNTTTFDNDGIVVLSGGNPISLSIAHAGNYRAWSRITIAGAVANTHVQFFIRRNGVDLVGDLRERSTIPVSGAGMRLSADDELPFAVGDNLTLFIRSNNAVTLGTAVLGVSHVTSCTTFI